MAWRYMIFACAMWWLTPGYSQQAAPDIPTNAHSSAGPQGWACNHGFTQVAELCREDGAVLSSESAFEVFDEGQWRCRSGYHRAGQFCVPGVAPAHATFVADGEHWQCDWGFQKVGSECQEVKAPPHGYIEASGHDWVCYPGFERSSEQCVPASTPPQPSQSTPPPQQSESALPQQTEPNPPPPTEAAAQAP